MAEIRIWSFEVGAVKRKREMLDTLRERSGLPPEQILVTGDTLIEDFQNPRAHGFQSRLLTRPTESKYAEMIAAVPDRKDRFETFPEVLTLLPPVRPLTLPASEEPTRIEREVRGHPIKL